MSADGREVLSLAFTFGADAGGAMSELQPFIGARNFAFHVGRDVLSAVVRARWTLRPADHEFVGDGEIEMPHTMSTPDSVSAQELINLDECTVFRVPGTPIPVVRQQPESSLEELHDLELLAGVG